MMTTIRLVELATKTAPSSALKKALHGSEAVLTLMNDPSHADAIAQTVDAQVFRLQELVEIDSVLDYEAVRVGLRTWTGLADALSHVRVNDLAIGDIFGSELFDVAARHHTLKSALKVLIDRDVGVMTLVYPSHGRGVALSAANSIPKEDARVVGGVCIAGEQVEGTFVDVQTESLDSVSEWLHETNTPLKLSVAAHKSLRQSAWRYQYESTDIAAQRPVMFCLTKKGALQMHHANSVLEALIDEGAAVHLASFQANTDISRDFSHLPISEIIRSNSISLRQATIKIATEIRAAIARQFRKTKDETWLAAASWAMDEATLQQNISARINQLCAIQRLVRQVGPVSIWVSDVKNPEGRIVVEAAWGVAPVFTSHAAGISEHIRNLPVIEPRSVQLAYGKQVIEAYEKRGLENPPAILTGAAHFDALKSQDFEILRSQVRARLSIANEERYIAILTARMHPEVEDAWLPSVFDWAASNQFSVLIKPHPMRVDTYDAVLNACGAPEHVSISRKLQGMEAIALAEIVVSDASNAAVEAVVANRPLVQVDAPGAKLHYGNLGHLGVAIIADGADSMAAALDKTLALGPPDEAAQARFAERFNIGNDGGAAHRCARALMRPARTGTDRISALELMKRASEPGAFDINF